MAFITPCKEPKCLRCGKCCYYAYNGVWKKCKYLILLPSGKTLCSVYRTRLWKVLDCVNGQLILCRDRVETGRIIEGCPYNSDIQTKSENNTPNTNLKTKD